MKLYKYNDFRNKDLINENLDKSKKFLKQEYILKKSIEDLNYLTDDLKYKLKEGDIKSLSLSLFTPDQQSELNSKMREYKLTKHQIDEIEKDKDFITLRTMLSKNIGYLYTFVYMFYKEGTPLAEIENMYKNVIEYKSVLDKLEDIIGKKFNDNFIDTTLPNSTEHRTNSEILVDGMERLKDLRKVKRILDTLTPKLRESYKESSDLLKNEMVEIAIAFEEIPDGDKLTSEKDTMGRQITKKERIWKNFFGETRKDTDPTMPDGSTNPKFGKLVYKSRLKKFEEVSNPIRELIKAAKSHIESYLLDGYNDRIEKIDQCNDKFGKMGCDVVFDNSGILIVQVNSYVANQFLNSHSNHCIVNYSSYWQQYLSDNNKQYYIYNFNISALDDLSTIGITIKPNRTWDSGACQSMRNNSIGSGFKQILKRWEKEYNIKEDIFQALEPMTPEEIKKREQAKIAERDIIKPNLTIKQIKKYVSEDGADINKDNSRALINAVIEEDYEKAKLCLSLGAQPNLAKGSESAISKASGIDMIKLLVSNGSDMVSQVFANIVNDLDTLKYCLSAGLDPNFNSSAPLRNVCRGSYIDENNNGESNMEAFKLLVDAKMNIIDPTSGKNIAAKWATEYGRTEIIDYIIEKGFNLTEKDILDCIRWGTHCRPLNEENRVRIVKYLENKLKELKKEKKIPR